MSGGYEPARPKRDCARCGHPASNHPVTFGNCSESCDHSRKQMNERTYVTEHVRCGCSGYVERAEEPTDAKS